MLDTFYRHHMQDEMIWFNEDISFFHLIIPTDNFNYTKKN